MGHAIKSKIMCKEGLFVFLQFFIQHQQLLILYEAVNTV